MSIGLLYTKQIVASLTSKSRLQVYCQADRPSTKVVASCTKVGAGGGGKIKVNGVEITRIESQTAKYNTIFR